EPGRSAVLRNVWFFPHENQTVGVGVADRDTKRDISSLVGSSGRGCDPIGSDVELFEAWVHEVSFAPGLAAVVAAVNILVVWWMKSCAAVQCVNGCGIRIACEQLAVLRDRPESPLISLISLQIDSSAHGTLP